MEFSVKQKNASSAVRISGILGAIIMLQSVLLAPGGLLIALVTFLLGMALAVWAVIVYQRTPEKPVTVMALVDDELTFTSLVNPAFSGGLGFEGPGRQNINDLSYMKPLLLNIPNVGDFVELSFYTAALEKQQAWFKLVHWQGVLPILHAVLDKNSTIKLPVSENDMVMRAGFTAFRDRLIDVDGFDAEVETSLSTRFLYQERLSEEVWQLLCKLPLLVFQDVARLDHQVKVDEVKTLASILRHSDSFVSLMLAEVLAELRKSLNDTGLKQENGNIKAIVREVGKLLEKEHESEWLLFRRGVLEIGHQVAETARDNNKQLPREYRVKLDNLKMELEIPVNMEHQ